MCRKPAFLVDKNFLPRKHSHRRPNFAQDGRGQGPRFFQQELLCTAIQVANHLPKHFRASPFPCYRGNFSTHERLTDSISRKLKTKVEITLLVRQTDKDLPKHFWASPFQCQKGAQFFNNGCLIDSISRKSNIKVDITLLVSQIQTICQSTYGQVKFHITGVVSQ